MLVNNTTLINNLVNNLNQVETQMQKYTGEISSGNRISDPGDDPMGTDAILSFQSQLDQNTAYQSNAQDGIGWLQTTQTGLSDLENIMGTARTLAVQAANGVMSPADQQATAQQVSSLLQQATQIANQKFGNNYLFGGTAPGGPSLEVDEGTSQATSPLGLTGTPSINGKSFSVNGSDTLQTIVNTINGTAGIGVEASITTGNTLRLVSDTPGATITYADSGGVLQGLGVLTGGGAVAHQIQAPGVTGAAPFVQNGSTGSFTYVGNAIIPPGAVQRQVGESDYLPVNLAGSGSLDIAKSLSDLQTFANDLSGSPSSAALQQDLTNIDGDTQNLTASTTFIGSQLSLVQQTDQSLVSQNTLLTGLQAKVQDADVAQVMMEFSNAQASLQATLKAGSELIQPTLLDFLK